MLRNSGLFLLRRWWFNGTLLTWIGNRLPVLWYRRRVRLILLRRLAVLLTRLRLIWLRRLAVRLTRLRLIWLRRLAVRLARLRLIWLRRLAVRLDMLRRILLCLLQRLL